MKEYLAIDVGGTNIKFSLMSETAEILEKGETPTPRIDLPTYVEALGQIYDRYADQIEAVVMSAPGKIDATTGFFYTGGALDHFIHEINLTDALKERIPVPFCVENDAKAAALAELWKGSMQGVKNGIVMTLGTGIGGALIIEGKLYRGSTFAAGEFSGIPTVWEDVTTPHSGWHHIGRVTSLTSQYAAATGMDEGTVDGRVFFEKANSGDETAMNILRDYCRKMSGGIYALQFIVDVQKVAIGGGISKQPLLMQTFNEEMDGIMEAMGATVVTRPELVACTFGNDANMIGALYHYLYEYKVQQDC